jgi:uncharacterized Zn-finger protein
VVLEYNCECGQATDDKTAFHNHLRTHTGEKRMLPNYCQLAHLSSAYQCAYCDKRFARAFTCGNHERTHTGDKRTEPRLRDGPLSRLSSVRVRPLRAAFHSEHELQDAHAPVPSRR